VDDIIEADPPPPYETKRQTDLGSQIEAEKPAIIIGDRPAKKSFSFVDRVLNKIKEGRGKYAGVSKIEGRLDTRAGLAGELFSKDGLRGYTVGIEGRVLGTGGGINTGGAIDTELLGVEGHSGVDVKLAKVVEGRVGTEGSFGIKGMHGRTEVEAKLEVKGKELLGAGASTEGTTKWWGKGAGTHGRTEVKAQVGEYVKGEASTEGTFRLDEGVHGRTKVDAKLGKRTAGKVETEAEFSWKDGLRYQGAVKGEVLGIGGGAGLDLFYNKHKKSFDARGVAVLKAFGNKRVGMAWEVSIGKEGIRGSMVVKAGKSWNDRGKSEPASLESPGNSEKRTGYDFEGNGPGKQDKERPGLSSLEKLFKPGKYKESQRRYDDTQIVDSTLEYKG